MSGFPAVTTKVSFQQRGKQRGYAQLPTVQPKGMVNRSLVEKKALEAIGRQRYLFIDFGVENSFQELERAGKRSARTEEMGDANLMGSLSQMSKLSAEGQKMSRFLQQQRQDHAKLTKFSGLMGKTMQRELSLSLSNIRERINPEKLEEYLQHKHNEQEWRKIRERESKLYDYFEDQQTALAPLPQQQNTLRLPRYSLGVKPVPPQAPSRFRAWTRLNRLLAV